MYMHAFFALSINHGKFGRALQNIKYGLALIWAWDRKECLDDQLSSFRPLSATKSAILFQVFFMSAVVFSVLGWCVSSHVNVLFSQHRYEKIYSPISSGTFMSYPLYILCFAVDRVNIVPCWDIQKRKSMTWPTTVRLCRMDEFRAQGSPLIYSSIVLAII
jgi:hypothetical protein